MTRRWPDRLWLEYGALALLIVLPLLKFGYVQTVDMVWGPRTPLPSLSDNSSIFIGAQWLLAQVITSMLVQKLLLLGTFLLAGVGAHRLAQQAVRLQAAGSAAYVAGLLYMFNPFIYTRLMQGQWLVLCGYALLPWAVGSFWQLQLRPSWRQLLRASAWTIGVGLTSIHAVGFVLLLHALLFAARGRVELGRRARLVAVATGLWLLANSLWLWPILIGHSRTNLAIHSFGLGQLHAFATTGVVASSVPLSSLLLEGFWADPQGRYYLPSHVGAWWYLVVGLLSGLIIWGAAQAVRHRDRLGCVLIVGAVIAWWLGMGIGSSWSASTTNWLVGHLPFYRGYREPQKWLMLLALSYSYHAASGLADLAGRLQNVVWRPRLLTGVLLLPVLTTPMLLWGAGGQLVSAEYPADWALAARRLDADHHRYQVLVLPWHEYLPISFTHRVVANPTSHYFRQPLIISDNPELRGVPPAESTPLYRLIDTQLLPQRRQRSDAAAQLAPYQVRYVLLLKEADWQQYGWVSHQAGWKLVQNSASLQLYEATD